MNNIQFYRLCGRAERISIFLILLSIVLFGLTVAVPVNQSADPLEVYVRNFSSIVAYIAFGVLLTVLGYSNTLVSTQKNMKIFKFCTLFLAIASFVKVVSSSVYLVLYFSMGNKIGLYYLGEAFVWLAVGMFALALKRQTEKEGLVKDESDDYDDDEFIDEEDEEQ